MIDTEPRNEYTDALEELELVREAEAEIKAALATARTALIKAEAEEGVASAAVTASTEAYAAGEIARGQHHGVKRALAAAQERTCLASALVRRQERQETAVRDALSEAERRVDRAQRVEYQARGEPLRAEIVEFLDRIEREVADFDRRATDLAYEVIDRTGVGRNHVVHPVPGPLAAWAGASGISFSAVIARWRRLYDAAEGSSK